MSAFSLAASPGRPPRGLVSRAGPVAAGLFFALSAAAPRSALADGHAHDLQAASGEASDGARTPEEVWLEGRLRAPCCWAQTLDVHESPLAGELRREVRRRLREGEPAPSIEDDFAGRFGERVRAVPRGGDARGAIVVFVGALLAAALAWAALAARRWLRAGRLSAAGARPGPTLSPEDDASYDAQIDEELRALE